MHPPSPQPEDATLRMLAAAAPREQAGALIGRYKLLEQIGEGGMGAIWMAEQREPVKRRVALKIIKLGMDTKQVIARFEAERQALALMDHPHIAKVLDAGSTETGRPYFVMEYIKGIPILEYCDREKLDTKARLELFTSVCHAIQHAHQKGIIHRDIKPSNVLVTLHDGVPVPKVIDFGIAKATNSELTAKTLFTEHRQIIGTPAYMSPEQAEMSGLDIDTRSDVYSLGVLLYELLTGTTPFDVKALLESGYHEMLRAIREDEPHKPSTRVSSLGDTGTRTALQRKVDLKKLSTLLRGDIDWIVMKCLEKDRQRRYETANGLASDIKRHLTGDAVLAAPPSASYRARKFVRRNRAQVIGAGAVALALLIGVVAFAWQAELARDQRDLAVLAQKSEVEQRRQADAAKADAEKQAAIAEAVARFQTEMLAAADPDKLLGDKVTVLQAMQAATKELDQGSLADQPLVEADVRDTIGKTLLALGRYDAAEPHLRQALAIRRVELPAAHPGIANSLDKLATLLLDRNEIAEAETLYREALAIRRVAHPAGHTQIALALNNLGTLLHQKRELAEAEAHYREALEIRRASLPAGDARIAMPLSNLAGVLQEQGKLDEAEPLCREALVIWRAALPAGHPQITLGVSTLAFVLKARNKLPEAEALFREGLEIDRAALPAGHPDIGTSLNNLALVLQVQGKLDEAEPLYREALEISRKALPAGHPETSAKLNNLALVLQARNELAEAEALFAEGLDASLRRSTEPSMTLAMLLHHHAHVLFALSRYEDAEGPARQAVEMYRAHPAWSVDEAKHAASILAVTLTALGRADESLAVRRQSLADQRELLPPESAELANQLAALGGELLKRDTPESAREAEPLLREALAIRKAKEPEDWRTFNTKSALGGALLGQEKNAEAEPLLLDGYRGMKEREASIPPAGAPRLLEAVERLVKLYEARGDAAQAAEWKAKR